MNTDALVSSNITSNAPVAPKVKLFGIKGRLNRLAYFLRMLILGLILMAASFVMVSVAHNPQTDYIFGLAFLVLFIPVTVLMFMLQIRRLHDLNLSGWWLLLNLLWFLGCLDIAVLIKGISTGLTFFEFYLFIFKGTRGANKYGPDPLAVTTAATASV